MVAADCSPADTLAKAAGQAMYAKDACAHWMGMRQEDVRAGYARVSMAITPEMLNGHGICHGGATYALADTAFAYACNSNNRITVAQTCTITYCEPVQQGDVITAEAKELVRRGKTGLYDVTLTNQHGVVVALFRGQGRELTGEVAPQ